MTQAVTRDHAAVRDYWTAVLDGGLQVPDDRPLADLTTELTTMLGSTDAVVRDGLAYPVLATWIERGVYDHLLPGLGDGMAAGLRVGLGESRSDTVFRRSFSVLVLAECVARDNRAGLVPGAKVLQWGDHVATWLVRERDVRGYVPGSGWAHAVAHGSDAIAVLAASPWFGTAELTVLLDVLADRLLLPVDRAYDCGEPDRLASATVAILRRNAVPFTVVEPWVARIRAAALETALVDAAPQARVANAQAFLRALHLQVELGPEPPPSRADLLLVLAEALRASNPGWG